MTKRCVNEYPGRIPFQANFYQTFNCIQNPTALLCTFQPQATSGKPALTPPFYLYLNLYSNLPFYLHSTCLLNLPFNLTLNPTALLLTSNRKLRRASLHFNLSLNPSLTLPQ